MFETRREADVATLARPGTTWLSTGWRGGQREADAAHWLTVPEGWDPEDLAAAVTDRLAVVGVDRADDPVLLTGVSIDHLRGARCGPVVAYATAGLSNPAALPMDPVGGDLPSVGDRPDGGDLPAADGLPDGDVGPGTVNVAVGTPLSLAPGALANLVAVAAEAKAATLLHHAGFPGTTTDAVLVACDGCENPSEAAGDGDAPRAFSGSATRLGGATRACVRDAVAAALAARYEDGSPPASVEAADHGVSTDAPAEVFDPLAGQDSG